MLVDGGCGSLQPRLVALLLAMGWAAASGIAQRISNLIMLLVCKGMDAAEAPHRCEEPAAVRGFLAARVALPHDSYGRQDRLFDALVFADDPRMAVVGSREDGPGGVAARPLRLAACFHDVVGPGGLNLRLADQLKWSCGVWSKWVGMCISPMLGLLWVPPDKALRADSELRQLAEGTMSQARLVSLLGFLNHLAGALLTHPYILRRNMERALAQLLLGRLQHGTRACLATAWSATTWSTHPKDNEGTAPRVWHTHCSSRPKDNNGTSP